jgi:hypothetical protein
LGKSFGANGLCEETGKSERDEKLVGMDERKY